MHETMKVKDLISALSAFNPEMEIYIGDAGQEIVTIHEIEEYGDDAVAITIRHYFPDSWYYMDESETRWERDFS